MEESILTSIKDALGIKSEEYTSFDFELIMHINSALASLQQIVVISDAKFSIKDKDDVWSDLLGDDESIQNAKEYVYLRVRMIFDPPETPHLINAFEERIREAEWRLQAATDPLEPWQPPLLDEDEDEILILDGGTV